ncbi:MAG: GntR family transcriptional regulator [Lachnospiraceae bacterium]
MNEIMLRSNYTDERPVYMQIIDSIKLYIAAGSFSPGEKTPSIRTLAKDVGVNPNTMQKSLCELELMGYIVSKKRNSSRYVTNNKSLIDTLKQEIASTKCRELIASVHLLNVDEEQLIHIIHKLWQGDCQPDRRKI